LRATRGRAIVVPMNVAARLLLVLAPLPGAGERAPLPVDDLPADFGLDVPALFAPLATALEPVDPAVHALGRALFFDAALSRDHTISCASCHAPAHGFADPAARSLGVGGARTRIHAPTLLNRGIGQAFSWTGRAATLREQVLLPIHDEVEMGLPLVDLEARLRADPRHGPAFQRAFGREAAREDVAVALESFVARIWSAQSAVDRFQAGEFDALDARERAGLWIFESKAACWRCHAGRNLTDEGFHATGVGAVDGVSEPGRAAITARWEDRGRFKTPTLRGLAFTAPYMHDGSLATLEDVVAFYRRGGNATPERDPALAPLDLDDAEAASLVAFLRALSR
jgi:cytochrome c peroxidase